jgi:hypothetical protein
VRERGEEDVLGAVGLGEFLVDADEFLRALPDSPLQLAVEALQVGAGLALGEHQVAVVEPAPDGELHLFDVAGLEQVVVGAVAQRRDGGLDVGVAGEDDGDGERRAPPRLFEHREAVALLHVEVCEDEVELLAPQLPDGLGPAHRHVHVVAFEAQHLADGQDDGLLVVDHQQPRRARSRVTRLSRHKKPGGQGPEVGGR